MAKQKRKYPQLLTVAELDAMGVDGFISMLGWSRESIEKYSPTRIIMPFSGTRNEAFYQICWGAHFAKMFGKAMLSSIMSAKSTTAPRLSTGPTTMMAT